MQRGASTAPCSGISSPRDLLLQHAADGCGPRAYTMVTAQERHDSGAADAGLRPAAVNGAEVRPARAAPAGQRGSAIAGLPVTADHCGRGGRIGPTVWLPGSLSESWSAMLGACPCSSRAAHPTTADSARARRDGDDNQIPFCLHGRAEPLVYRLPLQGRPDVARALPGSTARTDL